MLQRKQTWINKANGHHVVWNSPHLASQRYHWWHFVHITWIGTLDEDSRSPIKTPPRTMPTDHVCFPAHAADSPQEKTVTRSWAMHLHYFWHNMYVSDPRSRRIRNRWSIVHLITLIDFLLKADFSSQFFLDMEKLQNIHSQAPINLYKNTWN